MSALSPLNEKPRPVDLHRQIVDLFATTGNYLKTAEAFGLHDEQVRRVVKSPQGAFALEQTIRERARTRALRLGSLTDDLIEELQLILKNGCERILNGRREGDPFTLFLRPDMRDVVNALAWITHHVRDLQDSLSAIDVSNHDVSHEARSLNLASLKELVSQEERRLQLDAQRALASPSDADTGAQVPGGSISGADALGQVMHGDDRSAPTTEAPGRALAHPTPPRRERLTPKLPGGLEVATEEGVTWDDLE